MSRPKKTSREQAIECALEIIENEGLEALRLETLAQALHVSAPSLYHHFKNKDEILSMSASAIYESIPHRPAGECSSDNVVDYFVMIAIDSYRAMTVRPRCLPLLAAYTSPDLMQRGRERSLRALARTNVPKEYHGLIVGFVERLVQGSVFSVGMPTTEPSEDRWPFLAELFERSGPPDPERDLELSIRAYFAGLLTLGAFAAKLPERAR